MNLFESLVSRYRDADAGRFRECRRCGVQVADDSEECPRCGRRSIATYEL
jgi:rubrerythrin